MNHELYRSLTRRLNDTDPRRLTSDVAAECVSRLARFPFEIRPGDWFTTRPKSRDPNRPSPRCREIYFKDERPMTNDPNPDEPTVFNKLTIATLPHNYTFGPVWDVGVNRVKGVWQIKVLVKSICCSIHGNGPLFVWVPISHGVTQWARWQKNIGNPQVPVPNKVLARGDPCAHEIKSEDRKWHTLLFENDREYSWVSRMACQILRHEHLHQEDGAISLNYSGKR